MIRGFVTGLVWGGVVASAGLAVISQVAPLPQGAGMPEAAAPEVAPAPVAPQPADSGAEPAQPAMPATDTDLPAVASETEPAPDQAPEQLLSAPPDAEPAPAAPVAVAPATLSAAPDLPQAPAQADQAADLAPPSNGDLPQVPPLATAEAPLPDDQPAAVEPPPLPAVQDEPLLEKAPEPPAVAEPAVVPMAPSEPPLADAPRIFSSDSGLAQPEGAPRRIVPDGKPLTDAPDTLEVTPDLPRVGDAVAPVEETPLVATPLDLFSRPFDNPDGKPLFAILLADDLNPATDRETLAALPFAVTFVIDPAAQGAAEAAAIYRKAGQEVMMATTAVPKTASPADLEQNYQSLDMALPEAVAVLGVAGLDADSQRLATSAVPIISAQGRGIVTMERGLNAVDQVARREGVPQATIFRLLDAAGETVPVVRRYLDRAAFRAAQEGSVVVLGSTRPDTIAAILQWTVEGRGASVALAPISAVLRRQP